MRGSISRKPSGADTIAELEKGSFNKIRMCIFPKWYLYNEQ